MNVKKMVIMAVLLFSVVSAVEISFAFTGLWQKISNDSINEKTTNSAISQIVYVAENGNITDTLAGASWFSVTDQNAILISVHGFNENACDWKAQLGTTTKDITASDTNYIYEPVTIGQQFALKYTRKNKEATTKDKCRINLDVFKG